MQGRRPFYCMRDYLFARRYSVPAVDATNRNYLGDTLAQLIPVRGLC